MGKIPILLLLFFTLFYSTSSADEGVKLFKNYYFGTNRDEILKEPNVYDCSDALGNQGLCVDNQTFSNVDLSYGFKFINNKLIQVVLFSEYSYENYLNLFGTINSKFTLTTMQTQTDRLDLLELYKNDFTNANSRISSFESTALTNGNLTYIFIDNDNTTKETISNSDNVVQLIKNGDDNLREVDYQIITNEDGEFLIVSFSVPKMSLIFLKQTLKEKPIEDF